MVTVIFLLLFLSLRKYVHVHCSFLWDSLLHSQSFLSPTFLPEELPCLHTLGLSHQSTGAAFLDNLNKFCQLLFQSNPIQSYFFSNVFYFGLEFTTLHVCPALDSESLMSRIIFKSLLLSMGGTDLAPKTDSVRVWDECINEVRRQRG